jgi:hypothetical protein
VRIQLKRNFFQSQYDCATDSIEERSINTKSEMLLNFLFNLLIRGHSITTWIRRGGTVLPYGG